MLRLKAATSAVADFTAGSFLPVIGDREVAGDAAGGVRRVLLCTGKVYYDLAERRRALAAEAGGPRRRDRPGGAALPAAAGRTAGRAGQVPGRRGDRLGAGGAGQHGRLAADGAEAARACWAGRSARVSLPPSSAPAGGSATMHASEHRALIEAALQPAPRPRRAPRNLEAGLGAVFAQARSMRRPREDRHGRPMYFTDRGIEKLEEQRGDDQVSLAWVARAAAGSSWI